MNTENTIVVIASAGIFVGSTYVLIKTHRREAAKRAKIEAEYQRQIKAIRTARDKVIKKIQDGAYDRNFDLNVIFNDLKFETIVNRFEN